MNPIDRASYGTSVAAVTTIPWLQDTSGETVWTRWNVSKDEFWIVDAENRLLTVTNLGYLKLELPENRTLLRNWLLDAARALDTDADHLPDVWEITTWGGLSHAGTGDADGDGQSNFAEFAFGTDPTRPQAFPVLEVVGGADGRGSGLQLVYRRRLGSLADYWLERSSDLTTWTRVTDGSLVSGNPINLYDGNGMGEVQVRVSPDASLGPMGFMRVRASPAW